MIVPPDKTLPPPRQIGFAARWLKRSIPRCCEVTAAIREGLT
jgi:hypothetical protein